MIRKEDLLPLKPSDWAVNFALELALLKANNLFKGEERPLSQRYDSLYKGELARNVVIDWMKANLKNVELDERTTLWHTFEPCDSAKESDEPDYGWDIMHSVNHAIKLGPDKYEFENPNAYFVEVKSQSLLINNGRLVPLDEIIRRYDVTVPVKYKKGQVIMPGQDCATEVFVQAFHNRLEMKQKIDEEKLKKEISAIEKFSDKKTYLREFLSVDKRYPKVILAGWCFGKDVPDVAKKFEHPIRSNHGKNYWRFPLINARPMKDYALLR